MIFDDTYPEWFKQILLKIRESEWDVMIRELGIWLNIALSKNRTLSDVNYFERQFWIHLSLGKKHGIYAKKFSRNVIQRYHIDVFLDAESLQIGSYTCKFPSE